MLDLVFPPVLDSLPILEERPLDLCVAKLRILFEVVHPVGLPALFHVKLVDHVVNVGQLGLVARLSQMEVRQNVLLIIIIC